MIFLNFIYISLHFDHDFVIFQNCFNKYGESSFVFQILELVEQSKCIEREQHYIDTLKPTINIHVIACNSSLGTKLTEEQIRRHSVKLSKKYTVRSPEGVIYMEVIGLKPFCEILGLDDAALGAVAKGKHEHSHGWTAKPWDGTTDGLYVELRKYTVRSPQGEFFHVPNMTEFCEMKGISRGCMKHVARGLQKQHKGWTGKPFDGTTEGL